MLQPSRTRIASISAISAAEMAEQRRIDTASANLYICRGIRRAPTHRWRGGRVAEGGGLLNRYTVNPVSWVRIPSPPPLPHFSLSQLVARTPENPELGPYRVSPCLPSYATISAK